jgi:hypothetical protein
MTVVDENSGSIVSPQTTPLEEAKKGSYENEKDIIFARITPCMKNRKVAISTDLNNGLGFGSTELCHQTPKPLINGL